MTTSIAPLRKHIIQYLGRPCNAIHTRPSNKDSLAPLFPASEIPVHDIPIKERERRTLKTNSVTVITNGLLPVSVPIKYDYILYVSASFLQIHISEQVKVSIAHEVKSFVFPEKPIQTSSTSLRLPLLGASPNTRATGVPNNSSGTATLHPSRLFTQRIIVGSGF